MVTANEDRNPSYDLLTEESRRACLKIRNGVTVTPQSFGGEAYFQIAVPRIQKFIRIGYREYVFLSLLDGRTTTASALAESAQVLKQEALDEAEADQLIDQLLEQKVIQFESHDDATDRALESDASESSNGHWLQRFNPFWIKLPLTRLIRNPNATLDALLPAFRWCFHPAGLIGMSFLILVGIVSAMISWPELIQGTQSLLVLENWPALLLTWVVLKVVHELAHALCCRYHGGEVPESGIVFILLAPMAYVDVTSSWKFQQPWKRMAVAAAGMFVELVIATLALFAWLQVESIELRNWLMNVMVTAGVSTLLFNANPLMRFDGYFLLSDFLKLPNLYEAGTNSVLQVSQRLFYGQSGVASSIEIRDRGLLVRSYGVLASLWKVLICFSLSLAASVMLGGWGILLAVAGLISWIGLPAYKALIDFRNRLSRRRHEAVRATLVTGTIAAVMIASWFWIPSPFPSQVPCAIDYETSAQVRANTTGFVTEVCVDNGQWVEQGDVLLRLKNRELESRIAEARSELQLHQVHERISIDQREMAAAQMAIEDQAAAQKKLEQLRREQAELVIRAPNSGTVIGKELSHLLGTRVTTGDVLMTVGEDCRKEVLLSIATKDAKQLDSLYGATIPVRIGPYRYCNAVIKRIEPRATDRIPHPGLGVHNGGSLAVNQESEDGQPRLATPRFLAHAKMEIVTASQFLAGETGVAYLRPPKQTLGTWIWIAGHEWVSKQVRQVQEMQ